MVCTVELGLGTQLWLCLGSDVGGIVCECWNVWIRCGEDLVGDCGEEYLNIAYRDPDRADFSTV